MLCNLVHINIFQYILFRSVCSFVCAFLILFCFGNKFIAFLKKHQSGGQPIRDDGPKEHIITKQKTPTMGGILIIISILISTLLWGDISNIYLLLCIIVLVSFGIIGAIDDYKKVSKHDYHGISAKKKFLLQLAISIFCCYIVIKYTNINDINILYFPLFKNLCIDLSYLFIPWAVFIIIGSSNAVNLTDGLDGLAMGPIIITSISFAIICYVAGNAGFAECLNISYIPGISEICIFLSSLTGASLGFMWFNAPPARMFMGDTGSIAIGAVLGFISIISKHEILYAIIGIIFVIETLSVIIQVIYYKMTNRRFFLMAPIHHHFEKKGWKESTIVFRFWILSIISGIIGLAILKVM